MCGDSGSGSRIGIVQFGGHLHGGGRAQRQRVFAGPRLTRANLARGHRLHADDARIALRQRMQQRGGDQGLADAGVGAGDEARVMGLFGQVASSAASAPCARQCTASASST